MEEPTTAKRTRGKGKRTMMRAARIAAAQNGVVVADSLSILEEATGYFYGLVLQELRAAKPNPKKLKQLWNDAAVMAEKVIPYRHPKLSGIKVVQRDETDLTEKTLEQLRTELYEGFMRLQASGAFAELVEGDGPVGIANQTPAPGGKGRAAA